MNYPRLFPLLLLLSWATCSLAQDSIKVYPNPFDQQLTIEVNAEVGDSVGVKIYSLVGAEVLNMNPLRAEKDSVVTFKEEIDTGVYLLLVERSDSSLIQKVIKTNTSDSTDIWLVIDVPPVVGLDEAARGEPLYEIFPNPSRTGKVTLIHSGHSDAVSVQVFDSNGKLLHDAIIGEKKGLEQEIDLSAAKAGLYFVKLRTEKHYMVKKLVLTE